MKTTDETVSSTGHSSNDRPSNDRPLAEQSAEKAPGAGEVDPKSVDPDNIDPDNIDPKIGEIEDIEDVLYDLGSALLREAQDTASRFKLMNEMNKLSERKHRQLMVERRMDLERERFEHQREVKRQAMAIKQQELEIRR